MFNPAHPGEVLHEYLPDGMSVTEAAQRHEYVRMETPSTQNGTLGGLLRKRRA